MEGVGSDSSSFHKEVLTYRLQKYPKLPFNVIEMINMIKEHIRQNMDKFVQNGFLRLSIFYRGFIPRISFSDVPSWKTFCENHEKYNCGSKLICYQHVIDTWNKNEPNLLLQADILKGKWTLYLK